MSCLFQKCKTEVCGTKVTSDLTCVWFMTAPLILIGFCMLFSLVPYLTSLYGYLTHQICFFLTSQKLQSWNCCESLKNGKSTQVFMALLASHHFLHQITKTKEKVSKRLRKRSLLEFAIKNIYIENSAWFSIGSLITGWNIASFGPSNSFIFLDSEQIGKCDFSALFHRKNLKISTF